MDVRSHMTTVKCSFRALANMRQMSTEPSPPEMQRSTGPSPTDSWWILAPGRSSLGILLVLVACMLLCVRYGQSMSRWKESCDVM